tara:strand:+ start:342 stop:638 length:297 start_codon:yes stop_codon:yes gene_type:complete
MFIVTATTIRPNGNTPAHQRSLAFKQYFDATYCQTGQVKGMMSTESEDGLTRVTETKWIDQDAYDAFLADEQYIAIIAERKAYNEENGHQFSVERRVE